MERKKLISIMAVLLCCFSLCGCAENFDKDSYEKIRKMGAEAGRYMTVGNSSQAIKILEESLALCKKHFPLDEAPEAHKKLIKALYLPIYIALGTSYLSSGEHQKAIKVYEEGVKILPGDAWALYNPMAAIYFAQGEHQKAITICEKTIQLFPDVSLTYFGLGRIYANLGDYKKARDNLQKALDIGLEKGDSTVTQEAQKSLKMIP